MFQRFHLMTMASLMLLVVLSFPVSAVAESLDALIGDMNGDASVTVMDVNSFVLALTDPAAYQSAYGLDRHVVGDCDGSGGLNNLDIIPFTSLLVAGGSGDGVGGGSDVDLGGLDGVVHTVPEPSGLLMLATLGAILALRRRR